MGGRGLVNSLLSNSTTADLCQTCSLQLQTNAKSDITIRLHSDPSRDTEGFIELFFINAVVPTPGNTLVPLFTKSALVLDPFPFKLLGTLVPSTESAFPHVLSGAIVIKDTQLAVLFETSNVIKVGSC